MHVNGMLGRARRAAGRPRKGEANKRRDHLVDVASALFLEAGYHRVSLARIASEAGVAVRTIYDAFGGKAGLFEAVLRAGRARFIDDEEVLEPGAASIAAVLERFGLRYLRFLTDPQVVRLRRIVLSEAGTSQQLEQAFRDAGPGQTQSQLARYFSDERVRGQIRPDVPLELLPTYFIACIAGEYLWPGATPVAAIGEDCLHQQLRTRLPLFLRSVLNTAPAKGLRQ
jgi:AcrR family transcriptional regulator